MKTMCAVLMVLGAAACVLMPGGAAAAQVPGFGLIALLLIGKHRERNASRARVRILLGVACAVSAPPSWAQVTPNTTSQSANSFVQAVHSQLMLNGSVFRFGGTNCYVLMYSPQATVDQLLGTAQSNHFNVIRMRAQTEVGVPSSSDTFYTQYWNGNAPAYNDSAVTGLAHVDYAVYRAGQLGMKLIIPFVDNWQSGGMDQYVNWNGGQYHDQFYTDPTIRQWFKNWISHLLNHVNTLTGVAYKDDPTIMVWELANEPQCTGLGLPSSGTCTTTTIGSWIKDVSAYVKSVDSNHLVSVGDIGYFCIPSSPNYFENCSTGVDTLAFAETANVDVFGFHLYPEALGQTVAWADTFVDEHFADAVNIVGKPAYMGEFGLLDRNTRNTVYQDWTDRTLNDGGSGGLFWDILPGSPGPFGAEPPNVFDIEIGSPILQTTGNFEQMMVANGVLPLPPVAGDEWQTTPFGQAVTFTPLGNDIAYDGATVDPATIDLDPNTPGQQTSMEVYGGNFTVVGQSVQFTPAAGFNGQTQVSYTVLDSNQKLSNAGYLFVSVSPSATAPFTLESFEFGTDGWGPSGTAAGTVSQSSTFHTDGTYGLEVNVTTGGWFGMTFPSAFDLSGRTALAIDVETTSAGGASAIAFQSGTSYVWCQNANFLPLPSSGVTTVTVALDPAQLNCFGGTPDFTQVSAVYVALDSPGTYYLDNVRALPAASLSVLPQFAFGGGWYSALYFSNLTGSPVTFPVSFVSDGGTPLTVPSVGGSTTQVSLAANGTAIVEAPNTGSLAQGYAAFTPPSGVFGYGVFRQSVPGQADQEAVVPLSGAGATSNTLIWDDTTLVTAVSIVNPSSTANTVNVTLWDEGGNIIGTSSVALPQNSKTAVTLRSLPGLSGMVGKRGSAQFTVSSGSVAVLGLRFDGLAFTSIPTTTSSAVSASRPSVLPQFAFGGGWYSALYFTNLTGSPVSFPVSFVGDAGVPLTVPSVGGSTTQVNLAANGTTIIEAPNTGTLAQGYASFTLPSGVFGYGVFRQSVPGKHDQEAVVPLSDQGGTSNTLTWDDTTLVTAVSVVNPSSTAATVNVTLWDENGNTIGTSSIALAPSSKTAATLRSLPGLSGMVGQRGSAQFTATAGSVAVLGLRFDGLAFTSIPTGNPEPGL
jgi:mannan endo-1,4-beta-mannosidase